MLKPALACVLPQDRVDRNDAVRGTVQHSTVEFLVLVLVFFVRQRPFTLVGYL
jgi:hypothetical protein